MCATSSVINTTLKGSIDGLNRCYEALEGSADPKNCEMPKIAKQMNSRIEAFDQYKKEGKDNFIQAYCTFCSQSSKEGIATINKALETFDKSVHRKASEIMVKLEKEKEKKVELLNEPVSHNKVMEQATVFSTARKVLRNTTEKTDIRVALNPLEADIYKQLDAYHGSVNERMEMLKKAVKDNDPKYPQYIVDRVGNFVKKYPKYLEKQAKKELKLLF